MHKHSETSKLNHDILLLATVRDLREHKEQGELKMKEKDAEIESLKEMNVKKEETLETLKQDVDDLKQQLVNVQEQLTARIEDVGKDSNDCYQKLNETVAKQFLKTNQYKNDIDNLEIFAKRISKLHLSLSDNELQTDSHYRSLFQEDYDANKKVIQWNHLIKECDSDTDRRCEFLETLTASMGQYRHTVYPPTYTERLLNIGIKIKAKGIVKKSLLARIGCSIFTEAIRVTVIDDLEKFNEEIDKIERRRCKIQYDYDACSYYVGKCLTIVLYNQLKRNVFLLHKSNEREKLLMPNKTVVKIEDISRFLFLSSIVLHLKYHNKQ